MANFSRINEYIDTDDGTPGTLLIPKLIMPTLIEEVEKVLLDRSLAAMVITPNQIQGSSFDFNLETADSIILRQVGEGAEIPLDAMTFTNITFTPVKYGTAIRITREMTEDSQFELLQRNIRAVGRRIAENETKLILGALDGADSDTTGGASITIANLATAMEAIESNDFNPTDLLVGNEVLQDLRQIDTFVEANKSGSTEMLNTGFKGNIYGMNVHRFSSASTVTPSTNHKKYAYILDRSQAYAIALKRDITVENFDLPTYDMNGAAVTQRIDVQLLRSTAVARITTT